MDGFLISQTFIDKLPDLLVTVQDAIDSNENFYENVVAVAGASSTSSTIISILVAVGAVYLSWNRNEKETQLTRVLYALFAAIFGYIYLIYYYFTRNNQENLVK